MILRYLIFFIPVLFVALICFIATKTFSKYPKATKIISAILMTITIGYFQIFGYVVVYAVASLFVPNPEYNTIDKYEEALQASYAENCIQHFPAKIPENAKNVQFLRRYHNWFGSEEIFLKFDIDEKYIKDELKKYKFNYIEKDDNSNNSLFRKFGFILTEMEIPYEKQEDYIFYIINDRESETPRQNSFPYHYGIATNKKTGIIYYYISPD